MGTLYIVPTPIGNLEDITLRALRILKEVALIAAEDTRTTGRLLAHFGIETSQISYHEHNKIARLDRILSALNAGDVALVSDAGTPGLSDPGYELVVAAVEAGYEVTPLPGASALVPALVASGLPTDSFTYLGFLPRKAVARRAVLDSISLEPRTMVMYEAPHRLIATLTAIHSVMGDRHVVVARELTKLHEEIWRGPCLEAIEAFTEAGVRGEIVLVVAGYQASERPIWSADEVRAAFAEHLAAGEARAAAAKSVAADSGWSRRDVYNLDTP